MIRYSFAVLAALMVVGPSSAVMAHCTCQKCCQKCCECSKCTKKCCCCCQAPQQERSAAAEEPARSMPMVLPLIETAAVWTPVAYVAQRTLVSPVQARAVQEECTVSCERMENLEKKVGELSTGFADLQLAVKQQAQLLHEIARRLPAPAAAPAPSPVN